MESPACDGVMDVCAAVVFREGRLLLATRRPGSRGEGRWEFPGGKCEVGESFEETIRRELREELAFPVTSAVPVATISRPASETTPAIRLHFLLCQAPADVEPTPQEGQECRWHTPVEWDALDLMPTDRRFLEEYREELRGLSLETRLPFDPASGRLPLWLKSPFQGGEERREMRQLLREGGLHTVCEGAKCPNRCQCWKQRTATFMILGDVCTRACRFCSVNHGRPTPADPDEAIKVAKSVQELGLKYAVVTCVTRDDLPDGGASAMADVIRAIRQASPDTLVEVLTSDYRGDFAALDKVLAAAPAVFGHNLETVERLSPSVRSVATYRGSLAVLKHASEHAPAGTVVKSGMMLGLGESDEDIRQALRDLREAGVSLVTLGQYLQPTPAQLPVARFIPPSEFLQWRRYAEEELGFARAVCGPLVRSSYMAGDAYRRMTGR